MTTLYETIFTRRQVRNYLAGPIEDGILNGLSKCATEAEQLTGQHGEFKLVSAAEVSANHGASHFLLGYCDSTFAAYANVGFVLQKVDLYVQSIGLGSGWFMDIKPINGAEQFCIALAIGKTDAPVRQNETEFKRKPLSAVCSEENKVVQAVRLAPSSLNSQPWRIELGNEKVLIKDAGRGFSRLILKNKLNKIDIGIAARHAVCALMQESKEIDSIIPITNGKEFYIEINYQ